jgi:hypothetical protein
MASKGDVKAGGAFIRLFLKDDLTSNLQRSMKTFVSLVGPSVASAAAFAATAFKQFIDVGGQLNDMAARTGASSTALQHLGFAAKQTGASVENLEAAMRIMARNGFRVQDFESVGKAIAAIPDPTERAARAMEVFGKSGTMLIPMFQDLNNLKASSAALGPILSEEEVARADRMGDAIGALAEAYHRLQQRIGSLKESKVTLDILTGAMVEINEELSGKNLGVKSSGNPFQDIIDMFARVSKKGSAATGAFQSQKRTDEFTLQSSKEDEKNAKQQAKVWDDIARKVIDAHKARNALIAQFDTPAERFLKRQQEINQAMQGLQRAAAMGWLGKGDAAAQLQGLRNAMVRLQGEEMRRRMGNRPEVAGKQVVEAKDKPEIIRNAIGTFSAAGAASMQSGGGVATKTLDEIRASRKHLAELARMAREAALRRDKPGLFR